MIGTPATPDQIALIQEGVCPACKRALLKDLQLKYIALACQNCLCHVQIEQDVYVLLGVGREGKP